jgi:hypothetical protein
MSWNKVGYVGDMRGSTINFVDWCDVIRKVKGGIHERVTVFFFF